MPPAVSSVVRAAELTPRRWANGLGTTREIRSAPTTVGDRPTWRLSVADLPTMSTFSRIEDVDRIFTVVGTTGVDLEIGPRRIRCEQFEPVEFAGEDSPYCTAPHPTRAFNLIVARNAGTGQVRPHALEPGEVLSIDAHANLMTALFVVSGTGTLDGIALGAGDTAVIDSGSATFAPTAHSGKTKALRIFVERLRIDGSSVRGVA
ncbi:HutD family protein [Nocardia sp. 348MFTsu5.1]|uniref:HutD/Ves family protein n=1 Tax=Nocardia sp. 348MFTsu5.1 TaxID=1172185 RepID=UPI0003755FE2|nr:HutD family protein [Nocardia sp. 348MFTsu5.1]